MFDLLVPGNAGCKMLHRRFTIWSMYEGDDTETFLIREHDEYGEFPNIFCKVYFESSTKQPSGIILLDTGTGLNITPDAAISSAIESATLPRKSNIAALLEQHLNPRHATPYTIILSHCHYDHIGGIQHMSESSAHIQVYSSSHDIQYVTPYRNLQEHSLCESLGLKAPKFDAQFLDDGQQVVFRTTSQCHSALHQPQSKLSSLLVLHTPGHTPDSISIYDRESRTIFVGDLFYDQESPITRSGSHGRWGTEPPQPVVFTADSNIQHWSASMHKLLTFVRRANDEFVRSDTGYRQTGQGTRSHITEIDVEGWSQIDAANYERVSLSAAHVSVNIDAEIALLDMLDFMLRIQLDQTPKRSIPGPNGYGRIWFWEDKHTDSKPARFSVRSPWSVIHPSIPEPPASVTKIVSQARQGSTLLRTMIKSTHQKSASTTFKALPLSTIARNPAVRDG